MAEQRATSSAHLTTSDGGDSGPPPSPVSIEQVGKERVTGRFQAVINVHDCNLKQIEVALEANAPAYLCQHQAHPSRL